MKSSEHPDQVVPVSELFTVGWVAALAAIVVVACLVTALVVVVLQTQPSVSTSNAVGRRQRQSRYDRSQNPRIISRTAAAPRTSCVSGEVFDAEVGMCAPIFRAPLALESSILDQQHHTPCSSLYRYTCGKWIREHTNENRAFTYAFYKNEARVRKVITSFPGPLQRFYQSCMAGPIAREMQIEYRHVLEVALGNMRTHSDLPAAFGRLARMGFTTPFVLSIERHPTLNKTIPLFAADGFPPSLDEGRVFQIMNAARAMTGYNIVDEQRKIQGILRIMRAQQEHDTEPMSAIVDYFDYVEKRLPNDLVRFETLPQLWSMGGGREQRGWPLYFQELDGNNLWFSHDQQVWVIGRAYMTWLLRESSFDMYDWRAYLEFSILYNGAQFEPNLPSNVYFKQHDKRGPIGPGGRVFHRIPRAERTANVTLDARCVRLTQTMLPGLTAKAFLDTYFPDRATTRQAVAKVVARVLATLRASVAATPWLGAEDRAVLTRKMDATLIRVAEPEDWKPEPFGDNIAADRYDHNLNMVRRYRVQRNLGLWHRDVTDQFDRSAMAYFAIPTTSVNAYYSGVTNSITVLAGILQPPFYSPLYNEVTLYAILGSILGHEMSHMLDNHGLYWDDSGALHTKGILSSAGMRAFFDATDCVVSEYGDAPMGCEAANAHYGNSTLGEDMADLTGIGLSYKTLFRPDSPLTLSDKQQFFFILSQAFCASYDQEHLCEAVAEDEHAIPEMRIDRTVRNMRSYHTAFSCREGDAMYKSEQDVCAVY